MNKQEIQQTISNANLLLIGIGEEWEQKDFLCENSEYNDLCKVIAEEGMEWVMPYINNYFLKGNTTLIKALEKLALFCKEKNYFIISECMNGIAKDSGLFHEERIVEPCGSYHLMQCNMGCKDSIMATDNAVLQSIEKCIQGEKSWSQLVEDTAHMVCPVCGEKLVFNSLYAEKYAELGYLPRWETYTKWLQHTVNQPICIMELGVGLHYPTVIRWPFEKICFYNQKSNFIRAHKTLFQLAENMSNRGISVEENAVEFFAGL